MIARTILASAAAVALAGCGAGAPSAVTPTAASVSDGSDTGACRAAVSANVGGGTAEVVGTEQTGSETRVALRSDDGMMWRCRATTGVVIDLTVA